ncbi:MAG: hypothetical protein MI742_02425 [Desulfobacterales bacterium]|nr:hypothetical protein [Desulfobacterales bacterium]
MMDLEFYENNPSARFSRQCHRFFFSQISVIEKTTAALLKIGEKVIGGILGMGFGMGANSMGTITDTIGGLKVKFFPRITLKWTNPIHILCRQFPFLCL